MSHNVPLVKAIDHCSIIVANTEKSLEFYSGILGLEVDECRPALAYPGAWLNVGESQIHLLEVENPDPVNDRPEHGGRDRHLALRISDLETVVQRLQQAGIAYSKSSSGRAAVFCRDYDGNTLELVQV